MATAQPTQVVPLPGDTGYTPRTGKGGAVWINGPTAWAFAFLVAIGAPITRANLQAVVAWERREGGHWNNSRTYNPLNTTYHDKDTPGYRPGGKQGDIGAYKNWGEGLYANIATLNHGAAKQGDPYNYGPIIRALMKGNDANAVLRAIGNSSWCKGCYNDGSLRVRGYDYGSHKQPLRYRAGWVLPHAPTAPNLPSALGEADPQGITGGAATGIAKGAADVALSVPHFLALITKYLFSAGWWKRVGLGALGLVVVIIGLAILLDVKKVSPLP